MVKKRIYTKAELYATWTERKRATDGIWTRLVLRPLAFPTAGIFLRFGWTPNAVTYLSALICLLAFCLFLVTNPLCVYAGFSFLFIFGILDCADGTMARVKAKLSIWGDWVDSLGGYVAYTTTLLGIGFVAEQAFPEPAQLPRGLWILIGGIAATSNLLMRLVYKGYREIVADTNRKTITLEKKLSENIGITGFLVPASALGYAFHFLPWVIMAYATVYLGGCAIVIIKLVRKVEGMQA